jgi:hypothetical protein
LTVSSNVPTEDGSGFRRYDGSPANPFPDSGEMMVVVFRNKIQMIHEPHGPFQTGALT